MNNGVVFKEGVVPLERSLCPHRHHARFIKGVNDQRHDWQVEEEQSATDNGDANDLGTSLS